VRIARASHAAGQPSEQRSSTFTGTVHADPVMPTQDGVTVNNVFFTPGARTYWHTHEVGQVLYVLAGQGLVRSRDGTGAVLRVGDVVHIPAGEEHWHGAGPDTYLLHLTVSVGKTGWLDEVAEDDYRAALENA
jgi:quercetin dioxygenase-like cupin family protein